MVDLNYSAPNAVKFWKQKLDYTLTPEDWRMGFVNSKEVRLRVLQFKILHNTYPTNILLSKMEIKATDKCSECIHTLDVIEHFFFYCPEVFSFWQDISNYILKEFNIKMHLNVTEIMFGIKKTNRKLSQRDLKRINEILLLGKMCISIKKKTESLLSLWHIFENEMNVRCT